MAWTTPKTWASGGITASEFNTYIRDNQVWLKAAASLHGIDSDSTRGQLFGATAGVFAQRSTTQSITNNLATAVALNAADLFDSDAFHDTSTNNSRITIPSGLDGIYLLGGSINWAGSNSGRRYARLYLNATTYIEGGSVRDEPSGSNVYEHAVASPYSLSAGDYVELHAYQNSGGSLNLNTAVLWALLLFKT